MLHEKKNMGLDMVLIGFFSVLIFFGFFFVLEPDYSNSENTQKQLDGFYQLEDYQQADAMVQDDGTIEFIMSDGEIVCWPSMEALQAVYPEMELSQVVRE